MRWPKCRRALASLLLFVACFLSVGKAFADEIITDDRNIQRIRIIDMRAGELVYRDERGIDATCPVSTVRRIIVHSVGDLRDFTQAEEYAAGGKPEEAIVRYERALRLARGFWIPLVHVRILQASDRTNRFDRTLGHFLWILSSPLTGPAVASQLLPTGVPVADETRIRRAIERIDSAIMETRDRDAADVLHLLRYWVLESAGSGAADEAAGVLALRPLGESVATVRAYEIKLAALKRARRVGTPPSVLAGLDRALETCPESLLPDLLLLKGEVLLETASDRAELLSAASALMRVPIHFEKHPLAGRGLRLTAQVYDRLGRAAQAVALLEECLACDGLPDAERSAAQTDLARLRSTSGVAPR